MERGREGATEREGGEREGGEFVSACVPACALVQVCVCVFGCCFVGANGLLVEVCQCCCLLTFVCLSLSGHFPSCKTS